MRALEEIRRDVLTSDRVAYIKHKPWEDSFDEDAEDDITDLCDEVERLRGYINQICQENENLTDPQGHVLYGVIKAIRKAVQR